MRHRRLGRQLGRSSSHRKAMMRNMATSLFLTVREKAERTLRTDDEGHRLPEDGRIRTTLQKAKEVRLLVEKCITIAVRSREAMKRAEALLPPNFSEFDVSDVEDKAQRKRSVDDRRTWRRSSQGQEWAEARAPVVAAQRRVMQLLGNKQKLKRNTLPTNGKLSQRGPISRGGGITPQRQAVHILFHILAERFEDRPGGYTRILRLAKPRLGDAGAQAILEILTPAPDDSSEDRYQRVRATAEKPAFDVDATTEDKPDWVSDEEVAADNAVATDDAATPDDDQVDDKKDAE